MIAFDPTWTTELEAQLCVLVSQGLTSKAIADLLPGVITKNSVISKCRRMGLKLCHKPVAKPSNDRPKPMKIKRLKTGKKRVTLHRNYALVTYVEVPMVKPESIHPHEEGGVSLEECQARKNACRWPMNVNDLNAPKPYKFCGQPGYPYCPEHHKRAAGHGY